MLAAIRQILGPGTEPHWRRRLFERPSIRFGQSDN
jgi:hypothetical protein